VLNLWDYSSPRAKRSVVHRLEAMLLETPVHPTGPTIFYAKKKGRYQAASSNSVG